MTKYTVFVAYSLKDSECTSRPVLDCTHKLYDTSEEAIEAVTNEVFERYGDTSLYLDFELVPPKVHENGEIYDGYFRCRYLFGPMIHYDIYIMFIDID